MQNIEDRGDNATRFLVIGRELLAASGDDKTSILMSTSDTREGSGILHALLQPFAEKGISMTRIESRPSRRRNWDYVFFIDVDGHAQESPLAEAIAKSRPSARCCASSEPIPGQSADRCQPKADAVDFLVKPSPLLAAPLRCRATNPSPTGRSCWAHCGRRKCR